MRTTKKSDFIWMITTIIALFVTLLLSKIVLFCSNSETIAICAGGVLLLLLTSLSGYINNLITKSELKKHDTTLVTHRVDKSGYEKIRECKSIKCSNKRSTSARILDGVGTRCVIWVSIGKPSLLSDLCSGMIGKIRRNDFYAITFEVTSNAIEFPRPLKSAFGKYQSILTSDINLTSHSVIYKKQNKNRFIYDWVKSGLSS